ncbi:BCCT family transporter [Nocardiopsis exhalans]|uniref:BCCT family transporter n=1 Tax=Nocardiopsis exhalans TaxID=163604 RepID=A0ABY5D695_9ACTN|nr:BCCT family transporter [Nocardiopsis exhalans]USY18895.1 BCCT family transporter [Nocardiopsis exhalans]
MFITSGAVIIAFVVLGIAYTDPLLQAAQSTRDWIGSTLGWFYVLATTFFLGAAIFLMLSRFGKVRLGPDDSRPEFSTMAWFAMLFTTGMGIGLVFWGVAEPVNHLHDPRDATQAPIVVEQGQAGEEQLEEAEEAGLTPIVIEDEEGEEVDALLQPEAASSSLASSFFHWSFHPWAIYIAVGLSLGYFAYRKGLPLRPASALYPLLGERAFGWPGNIVDVLAVFGTIFGLATSLGLGTLQISSGLSRVFGIPDNGLTQSLIIIVITAIALFSVLSGIDKGLRRLSVINLWLAFLLLAFVFVAGPKLWMISGMTSGAGEYLENLIPWSLSFPSPLADEQAAGFTTGWSVFYWGWWISWAPFVGIFLARISYGRTIREFILGALFAPVVVSVLWFGVFGGSGLYYELFGDGGFQDGNEADAAFHLMEALPLAPVVALVASLLLILVVTIFFVTSSDSGSLVVDMLTNGGSTKAYRLQRGFWAVSEGAVTLILLVLGGALALDALQAASVVTGLPFAVILIFMLWGLFKALASEPKPGAPKRVRAEDRPPAAPSGNIRVGRKGEEGTPEEAEGT